MATTTAALYRPIKSYEDPFPIPAPYVTVNVGTFDVAFGSFTGLTTTTPDKTLTTDTSEWDTRWWVPTQVSNCSNPSGTAPAVTFTGTTSVSIDALLVNGASGAINNMFWFLIP
jgi:hypothetical protein